jgi:hypothetical protein
MVNRGETTRYKSYARHRQTTITSGAEPADDGVRFVREDELVAAIDEETGAAGCGPSRPEALAMLADALALHERDDEVLQKAERDDVLRSAGLDPDEIDAVPDGHDERPEQPVVHSGAFDHSDVTGPLDTTEHAIGDSLGSAPRYLDRNDAVSRSVDHQRRHVDSVAVAAPIVSPEPVGDGRLRGSTAGHRVRPQEVLDDGPGRRFVEPHAVC